MYMICYMMLYHHKNPKSDPNCISLLAFICYLLYNLHLTYFTTNAIFKVEHNCIGMIVDHQETYFKEKHDQF